MSVDLAAPRDRGAEILQNRQCGVGRSRCRTRSRVVVETSSTSENPWPFAPPWTACEPITLRCKVMVRGDIENQGSSTERNALRPAQRQTVIQDGIGSGVNKKELCHGSKHVAKGRARWLTLED